jgi:hypothetical protein
VLAIELAPEHRGGVEHGARGVVEGGRAPLEERGDGRRRGDRAAAAISFRPSGPGFRKRLRV